MFITSPAGVRAGKDGERQVGRGVQGETGMCTFQEPRVNHVLHTRLCATPWNKNVSADWPLTRFLYRGIDNETNNNYPTAGLLKRFREVSLNT